MSQETTPITRTPIYGIQKYCPVDLIATGGMGDVFKGYITFPLRQRTLCAIKCIRDDILDVQSVALFAREAMVGRAVSDHPNIVPTRDFGRWTNGRLFIVQDLEGPSLRDVRDQFQGHIPRIWRIARDMVQALGHLRRKGVIHRDISLSNIVLSPSGRVKLADFGLARFNYDVTWHRDDSLSRGLVGVPSFASPEVLLNRRATHESDLYSLGAILYLLVTGKAPYGGGKHAQVAWKAMNGSPAPLPGSTPPQLKKLIDGLIQRQPENRLSVEDALALISSSNPPVASGDDITALVTAFNEGKNNAGRDGSHDRTPTLMPLEHAAREYLQALGARESPNKPHGAPREERPSSSRRTWPLVAGAALLVCIALVGHVLQIRTVAVPAIPASDEGSQKTSVVIGSDVDSDGHHDNDDVMRSLQSGHGQKVKAQPSHGTPSRSTHRSLTNKPKTTDREQSTVRVPGIRPIAQTRNWHVGQRTLLR